MKSKIRIDVDLDKGEPVIIIDKTTEISDDVRDKLISGLIQSLGYSSNWMKISTDVGGPEASRIYHIRTIKPQEMKAEAEEMIRRYNDEFPKKEESQEITGREK